MSEMTSAVPVIAVRSSGGIVTLDGPESYVERPSPKDTSKVCRAMLFSPKGQYFAWINGSTVEVVRCSDWSPVSSIPRPRALDLQFSPQSNYIVIYELFSTNKDNPEGGNNMHIYRVADGSLVHSFVQKKQTGWQPSWSSDEKILGRLVNNEVVILEEGKYEEPVAKLNYAKVAGFSLSPSPAQRCHVICHLPGASGMPSFGKLFQYPKFESTQALASKGFFQGETCQFFWNDRGTSVLFMTSTEVDKTGSSYYGRQTLHYASTKGDTSMVQLSKEGPIYDVAWSPKGVEFCVVYGTMPAKATLFNLKCNPVFEFGTAARNAIYYSPNGNRLLLAGFGNIQGRIEVWDSETKRQLVVADAPDTTGLTWDPRSESFISFTTAPRLRTDNGFKVWHSTGTLMHEVRWPQGVEMYEVSWQPGTFPASALATRKPKAAEPSRPTASKTAYRPPSSRGTENTFKLHDDDELPHKPGQVVGDGPSKAALKQKKKREARKAKKAEEQANPPAAAPVGLDGSAERDGKGDASSGEEGGGGRRGGRTYEQRSKQPQQQDPEKEKKIKNIIKKLEAIAKLKLDKADGKTLDLNQNAKIAKENDLLKELGELNL